MNIAGSCIRHKVATILSVIMVSIFGIMYGSQLQVALMPDMEAPMAMVMCYYVGATPSDMEELVTRPLESAIMSVSGVDEIESTTADSVTMIQVTYVDGTKEVASSVIASTLTTMAVFIPLAMVEGIAGDMFRDFSLTIASLIGASLVISLTLVPLLRYFVLNEEKTRKQREKRAMRAQNRKPNAFTQIPSTLSRLYQRVLNFFVHHLGIGMLTSVALVAVFALTLFSTNLVLIPDMDQGRISISIEMPLGSELDESAAISDRVAAIVERECPEMEDMFYLAQDESVTMMINLVSKGERERSSAQVVEDLRPALQDIAGCEITVDASSSLSMLSGSDINVEISGDDIDTLAMIANDLVDQISALPDAVNVDSSIVLVEYIRIRREIGESREEAILHACPLRVRPIMMTTLTTVLTILPMALGIGDTNEMMSDMGVVMISGMVVSTLITLVFTPVFYSVIDNLSHIFRKSKRDTDQQALAECDPI